MCERISSRYNISTEEVYEKYIFANDIDQAATSIFSKHTGCVNISNEDGLVFDISEFDILIGNPPYVKIQNLSPSSRAAIKQYTWCIEGNSDIYIAMAQKFVNSGKIFGFICPNSWQKSKTGVNMVEEILKTRRLAELIDFRTKTVFKSVGAYCSILIGDGTIKNTYDLLDDLDSSPCIKQYALVKKTNFYLFDNEIQFISSISKKEIALFDVCSLKVGLATLSDKLFFLPNCTETNDHYVSDGIVVEKGITKPCYKVGKLSRYEEERNDRILFPYDKDGIPLTENFVMANFPKAYLYFQKIKKDLMKRDGGKFANKVKEGKSEWYEYGRYQGMSLPDEKILMSPIVTQRYFKHVQAGLFISGYCLIPNKKIDIKLIIEAINTDEFKRWVKLFGSPKQGGYYAISKRALQEFRFDLPKEK